MVKKKQNVKPQGKRLSIAAKIIIALTILILLPVGIYIFSNIYAVYTYNTFAKKVIPANYRLVNATINFYSIDSGAGVTQIYTISSTRKAIVDQLRPLLQRRGFTLSKYAKVGDFYRDSIVFKSVNTNDTSSPGVIVIQFIPDDAIDGSESSDGPFHTAVHQVNIHWE
jgi:hypothetical protein